MLVSPRSAKKGPISRPPVL
ncbi:hypothetical protein NQ317_004310 [Molorchus minor]|uniref:Uncharacterized protein n=1 Tax=Molorchus minor TaxID=1323400 RepID=A0ABQ9K042_9CUCU|nr:hypothetical protein NQ317_004310 [Molorchus minor]